MRCTHRQPADLGHHPLRDHVEVRRLALHHRAQADDGVEARCSAPSAPPRSGSSKAPGTCATSIAVVGDAVPAQAVERAVEQALGDDAVEARHDDADAQAGAVQGALAANRLTSV